MPNRIRRLIAGLTLTAAAATATALAAPHATADTHWGAEVATDNAVTTQDTHWGTSPTDPAPSTGDPTDPPVTTFDTHWG